MPSPVNRTLYRMLFVVPFLLGGWMVLAALFFKGSAGAFLWLFLTIPVGFLQMAIFGLVFWLRPSIRMQQAFSASDKAWYFGTLALWAVGAALPGWGELLQLIAFFVGAIGITRVSRRAQEENVLNMQVRVEQMRQQYEPPMPPTPQVSEPEEFTVRDHDGTRSPLGEPRIIEGEIIDDSASKSRRRDDDEPEEWTAHPRST